MKATKTKEQVTCEKGGIGMTTKVGGLTLSCDPRQDVRRWSTFVATRCTPEFSERRAYVRRRRRPSRQDRRRLARTTRAAQNWEEELASTLIDLKLTRGIACPCGKVAPVHGDDIMIGGERSAMELLIKMILRKHEFKK